MKYIKNMLNRKKFPDFNLTYNKTSCLKITFSNFNSKVDQSIVVEKKLTTTT